DTVPTRDAFRGHATDMRKVAGGVQLRAAAIVQDIHIADVLSGKNTAHDRRPGLPIPSRESGGLLPAGAGEKASDVKGAARAVVKDGRPNDSRPAKCPIVALDAAAHLGPGLAIVGCDAVRSDAVQPRVESAQKEPRSLSIVEYGEICVDARCTVDGADQDPRI